MPGLEKTPNWRTKTPGSSVLHNRKKDHEHRVKRASPTGDCCIFEHMPKKRSVQLCHVFPRYNANNNALMESLEVNWDMEYWSLNLDTKYNAFFDLEFLLEPFPHAGLPVYQENQIFQYQLVSLNDATMAIHRLIAVQPDSYKTHAPPFATLGEIASHVRPHFIVMQLGSQMDQRIGFRQALQEHIPASSLDLIESLYGLYTTPRVRADKSRVENYIACDDYDVKEDHDNDGDDPRDKNYTGRSGASTKTGKTTQTVGWRQGGIIRPRELGGDADVDDRLSKKSRINGRKSKSKYFSRREPNVPGQSTYLRSAAADPNEQRCLVENYPKERAIQLTHILPRSFVRDGTMMSMLEWNWNMRRGTLNLDTRENVCYMGASMKLLYENGQWGLLPEDHIIYEHRFAGSSAPRSEFPIITGDTFSYTFIPLTGMDDIALTRQTKHPPQANGFETHLHPYRSFPKIVSHVHPRFAIMAFGLYAEAIPSSSLDNLCRTYPIVNELMTIVDSWNQLMLDDEEMEEDPTYISPEVLKKKKEEVDVDEYETDGDSVSTVPRRILHVPPPARKRGRVSEDSEDELEEERPPSKSRRIGEKLDPNVAEDQAWSADKISEWAREVSKSPPLRDDRACI
ncbi:hypothetical protein BKA70DRAFT_1233518 [Coprinopsis sp. MPI-PUGE-AT-0042]|nr:hypothetical protein BKA70DRAFT_1233518 [Coprinopsis sp. MPI-PUGE-AT-0042]